MARRHVAAALIFAPIAAYAAACAVLYATQRKHIYKPKQRENLLVPTMPLPAHDGEVLVSIREHEDDVMRTFRVVRVETLPQQA